MSVEEQIVIELSQYEIVFEQQSSLDVIEESTLSVIEETSFQILEIGTPGPAGIIGPQGPQGIPGEPGGTSAFEEALIESIIPTEFELADAPTGDSLRVFVNGLLQHTTSYSLSGTTVTLLPDLSLMPDDRLGFAYNH